MTRVSHCWFKWSVRGGDERIRVTPHSRSVLHTAVNALAPAAVVVGEPARLVEPARTMWVMPRRRRRSRSEASPRSPRYRSGRISHTATLRLLGPIEERSIRRANAKKILRIIIGPAPDDPEYEMWWRGRLISVRQMREQGQPVEWAAEPPVPLPEDKPAKEPPEQKPTKPARKARSRKKAG